MKKNVLRVSRLPRMVALLGILSAACTATATPPAGAPVADPAPLAAELTSASIPAGPKRATFRWTLDEAGSRVSGRGVVRALAPDRIRLDLFGPRNESYLSAALVDGAYRLPAGVGNGVALPTASLLWGGMGVAHPPAGAALTAAGQESDAATLRYRVGEDEEYRYRFDSAGTATRLRSMERLVGGSRVESVRLTWTSTGLTRAEYRNWAAFRELILDYESITDASPFESTVWEP